MSKSEAVFIVSGARTPIGSFQGSLAPLSAPQLASVAFQAALSRASLNGDAVDAVYLGNVLSAGIGQAPARQASILAGLPASIPTVTVSKVCGSGMEAVIQGVKSILLGDAQIVMAGGAESMSNVPYYLPKARTGLRMGNSELIDGMIHDGLWDPYDNYHMGEAGERCADEYSLSRELQDEFAKNSYEKALAAESRAEFEWEIAPVTVPAGRGQSLTVSRDDELSRANTSKLPSLRSAFRKDGTITAGNASSINDGAAALLLVGEKTLKERNLTPLARIEGYSAAAHEAVRFTTAPALAMKALHAKLGLSPKDVDLYEINEAFSCVPLACARLCELPEEKINILGGAVALGHPIGASGARILLTLLNAMRLNDAKRGIASICIGGGEALAMSLVKS